MSFPFRHTHLTLPGAFPVALLTALLMAGCAPSALQMANEQADAASKTVPQIVDMEVPFDAAQAKAALAKGNRSISGVLYHRLDITGRDEQGWPASPLIKNQPLTNISVFLYPASAPLEAYEEMSSEQQRKMKKWYTNPPSPLNRQPQIKLFRLPAGTNNQMLETKTDNFGRYSFNNLKPGRYYVTSSAWQSGSYNKSVYAGSSEYTDGTGLYGARATAHHSRAVPVSFKTYLMYGAWADVSSDSTALESRMAVDYNKMSLEYNR